MSNNIEIDKLSQKVRQATITKWQQINIEVHNILEKLQALKSKQALLQNMVNDDSIMQKEFQTQIDCLINDYENCLNKLHQLQAESLHLKNLLGIK